MMVLLALFGGMALLLYGIRLSGDSLQRAAGARLKELLTGLAGNRFLALLSGATVTAIIQSSAATTMMAMIAAKGAAGSSVNTAGLNDAILNLSFRLHPSGEARIKSTVSERVER